MSTFVLKDCTTWVAGYDMTTDLSEMEISAEVDVQEKTTFGGDGWRTRVGGLNTVSASLSGFWQSAATDAIDPQVFTNLGTGSEAVTVSTDGVADSPAYLFRGGKFSYDLLGAIGEVAPFSLEMQNTDPYGLIRGKVAKAKGNVSATGALGSGLTDLSSNDQVSATQYLYAVLHVFSAGTTITVIVESDDNAGFTTPTTRGTIGPITAAGGTWLTRVAGPITDTHYRLNVSAITGTFSVAGAIAIQ